MRPRRRIDVHALAGLLIVGACNAPNPRYEAWSLVDMRPADVTPRADSSLPDGSPPDAFVADAVVDSAAPPDAPSDVPPGPDAPVDIAQPDVTAMVDATPNRAPDAFAPPAACGSGTADVGTIMNADGVVVDTDGTMYVLTDDAAHSYVGRISPGGAPELRWLRVDNSPATWGLALDSARQRLYVLVVSGVGALVAFDDIRGIPRGRTVVTPISNGNDVLTASDGTVYYTQQGDRRVYRVSPDGGPPSQVTSTPLGNAALSQLPSALALEPTGNLLVGLERGGPIYRLVLVGGAESSRLPLPGWMGSVNGLTFDRRGQLYVSIYDDAAARPVVRLDQDGTATPITPAGRFSSITFGRGALDCRDLYVADPLGPMRRVRVADSL